MRPVVVVPAAGLLVVVLLVAGCADSASPPALSAGTTTGVAPATAASPALAVTPNSSGPFNGTDVAWLQLTVAMHERVLLMLDLVPEHTADPAVRRLAAKVRGTHRADLERSRSLLERSGAPKKNPHEGHDMPGMVTVTELKALAAATGAAFQRLFGQYLRVHLEQSVRIAESEQKSGAEPATTTLAGAMVRTGRLYLGQLAELTAQRGGRS